MSTAVEVRGSKFDFPTMKSSFLRKNSSKEEFKDVLLRVNNSDVDESVSIVKPSYNNFSDLSGDKENREQLSENSNQDIDNRLLYGEYLSTMIIPLKSKSMITDVLGKQDLSKEGEELASIPASTNICNTGQQVLVSVAEAQQSNGITVTVKVPDNKPVVANAQEKTVMRKPPDLVTVVGRVDNNVKVSEEQLKVSDNKPVTDNVQEKTVTEKLPDLVAVAGRVDNNVKVSEEQVKVPDNKPVVTANTQEKTVTQKLLPDLVAVAGRVDNNVKVSEEQVKVPDNKPVAANAQEKTVMHKLPDSVAVLGRVDNNVKVSEEQVKVPDNKPVVANAQEKTVPQKLPDLAATSGGVDNNVKVSEEQVKVPDNKPVAANAQEKTVIQKLPDLAATSGGVDNNVKVSEEQVKVPDNKPVAANAQEKTVIQKLPDLAAVAGGVDNNVKVSEEQVKVPDNKPVAANAQEKTVTQKLPDLAAVAGGVDNNVKVSEEQVKVPDNKPVAANAQEKTVPQKLPDLVMVEGKNVQTNVQQSTVLVNDGNVKNIEITVNQEGIAKHGTLRSKANSTAIEINPAITNVQTTSDQTTDQAKVNNAENIRVSKLIGQGELQVQLNPGSSETVDKAKVAAGTGTAVQNQTALNTNSTMAAVQNNGVAGQGAQNGNTGEQNDSEKGRSEPKINQVVKDSESPHGKQVTPALHKAQVTGEPLPINAAPQNVISSKEPVNLTGLPQEVPRLLEQAKVKVQDKPIFLQLKLEPEQLGELVIKLTYKKGEMSAQFITSSLQAKDALESTMKQLKDALAQHQVTLHEPIVSVGSGGEQSMRHGRQNFNGKKYTQSLYGSSGAVDDGNVEVGEVSRHNDVLLSGKGVNYVI